MIILSFDIGIKNLAYCMLDSEDGTILDWNLIDCTGVNETLRVIEELDQLEHLREADVILLEKQPSFNPKMRNISTAIYVYFMHCQLMLIKPACRHVIFLIPSSSIFREWPSP